MSQSEEKNEKTIAKRRWRNMMIAAMAGHKITPERREHLDKMRQQLGISIDEAREIVDEYRHFGGGITLFGDKFQRMQVFRDIISMLLAEGEIDEKGRALLQRMAQRLDIDQNSLARFITEGQAALRPPAGMPDSRESQRLSRRIFRRMISENKDRELLLKEFDSLDRDRRRDLELKILENIVHKDTSTAGSDESVRTRRQRISYLEDQRCARELLALGVVTEAQIRPFREKQEKLFEEEGRVVSYITEMVKSGAVERDLVDKVRARVRTEHGDEQEDEERWKKSTDSDMGGLTIRYRKVTLDHTFRASCIGLAGFLDHNTAVVLQKIFDDIFAGRDDASRLIILEMGELTYVSSAGVGTILNARATALDRWGDIRFVNVSPEAQEIFNLIGVDQVFTFCNTIDDALWSFTDLAIAREL